MFITESFLALSCNGAKFFALFGVNLCTSSSAARRFYLH